MRAAASRYLHNPNIYSPFGPEASQTASIRRCYIIASYHLRLHMPGTGASGDDVSVGDRETRLQLIKGRAVFSHRTQLKSRALRRNWKRLTSHAIEMTAVL